jgi:hypothetical protein
MKDKGLIRETIHCYATAIRLMPRFAAAHSNLGSVLKEQVRTHLKLLLLKERYCSCISVCAKNTALRTRML